PDARLLVTIPVTDDRLVLRRLGREPAGESFRAGELRSLVGHPAAVTSVAVFPGGRQAGSAGFHQTLPVLDLETGKESHRFEGHDHVIWCVAVSPDGRFALSGSQDKTVRLWDLESGKERHRLEGHQGIVSSVAFFPDGRQALSASWDKTVHL